MEQNQNIQEIDVRKIVRVVSEHWWWFAAGIAFFMLLGTLYYLRKTPLWTTDASIVLRQNDGMSEHFNPMAVLGLNANTEAEDEVAVLSSRGLMYQSLDALNLWDYNYKKDGMRWVGEFRSPALKIEYLNLTEEAKHKAFSVIVKPNKKGYKVKVKMGHFSRSTARVDDLSEPIQTVVGTLFIHPTRPLSPDTTYRVFHTLRGSK